MNGLFRKEEILHGTCRLWGGSKEGRMGRVNSEEGTCGWIGVFSGSSGKWVLSIQILGAKNISDRTDKPQLDLPSRRKGTLLDKLIENSM
jgi:hypothetical protein